MFTVWFCVFIVTSNLMFITVEVSFAKKEKAASSTTVPDQQERELELISIRQQGEVLLNK